MDPKPPILTVAAVIADREGRLLLVRKRGSHVFTQPGGKREAGEDSLVTLARELAEELGVQMGEDAMRLGEFEDDAVNEPGRRVRAEAFLVTVSGTPTAQAEIEELIWVLPAKTYPVPVAPLSTRHIIPAYAVVMDVLYLIF